MSQGYRKATAMGMRATEAKNLASIAERRMLLDSFGSFRIRGSEN
jgi:hypothetical protein